MSRYKQHVANSKGWSEWETPVMRGYKLACCDCGLVHGMEFQVLKVTKWLGRRTWRGKQVSDHKVAFRVRRLNRATAQVRRHMKKEAAE